jgi:hypothetical protein
MVVENSTPVPRYPPIISQTINVNVFDSVLSSSLMPASQYGVNGEQSLRHWWTGEMYYETFTSVQLSWPFCPILTPTTDNVELCNPDSVKATNMSRCYSSGSNCCCCLNLAAFYECIPSGELVVHALQFFHSTLQTLRPHSVVFFPPALLNAKC